ncbi:MAG: restriction endonuclease subunit S [Bacilli bacterium]|nr:restriction endonuclease subunit S [Bacilli bacterium]
MNYKLKDIIEFNRKSTKSASFGRKDGLYPFFTSSNEVSKFSDEYDYDAEALIIGDGGTGNCKYYKGKFSASDHNYVLTSKNKQVPLKLIHYFLMKDNYKILNDGFRGVGIKNISKTYIGDIDFSYNSAYTIDEITAALDSINSIIASKQDEIIHLDDLIKSRFILQEVIA